MARYCPQCGEVLVPGAKFCPGCGKNIPQQSSQQNQASYNAGGYNNYAPNNSYASNNSYGSNNGHPVNNGAYNSVPNQNYYRTPAVNKPTKKEYRKICTNEKYRKELKTSAIILYVLIVLNALLSIAANPVGLLDVGIYLVLTLCMHLNKSKGCAIGVLCYAIFCVVVTMISTGNFAGWLWLIAAMGGIKAFSIADKEYEATYGA